MMEISAAALAAHPFLRGMSADHLGAIAEAARDVRFPAGHQLVEDGGYATRFWLIQSGRVSLDLYLPGDGSVVLESIGLGELLGLSWLFPPYKWVFGAVAVTEVRAFEFDAPLVRKLCDADPELGHDLYQRVTRVLAGRLQATRIGLIARSGAVRCRPGSG
jgi:CRP/FNR family transcriptional regulator, cyclic AMP receptor protein